MRLLLITSLWNDRVHPFPLMAEKRILIDETEKLS